MQTLILNTPLLYFQRYIDSSSSRYAWKEIPHILSSGDLDPESNDVVHKLSVAFSDSIETGNELKPVFGARELDESHFILDAEEVKQSRDEIMECIQNQDIDDRAMEIKTKSPKSRHDSLVLDKPKRQNNVSDINEQYAPLLEVPKGIDDQMFER